MKRKIRLLSVEDDPGWGRIVLRALDDDFDGRTVTSLAEARNLLKAGFFHLLVLDIRLEDGDTRNVQGMTFLEELSEHRKTEAMKVVMLSGYGTREQMREALRDYSVVDFLDKSDFDRKTFAPNLKAVVTGKLHLNLDLDIQWERLSGAAEAVQGIKVQGERVSPKDEFRCRRFGEELEDLLCRLFHEAESVLVEPLVRGRSGAGVLLCRPIYPKKGPGEARVVKFGDVPDIRREAENYREHVANFIRGHRATRLEAERRTAHLAGLGYSLLGGATFESWGDFYQRAQVDQVREVLDNLFLKTCANWYLNAGKPESLDMTEAYREQLGFTDDSLEEAFVRKLANVKAADPKSVRFRDFGSRTFRNPLDAIRGKSFRRHTHTCATHGDLNAGNLLVDKNLQPWLIDFLRTGEGHYLRDLAQLDATTRFLLLAPEDASLEERLALEEVLARPRRFGDVEELEGAFSSDNRELTKVFETCLHLRKLAAQLARNPSGDFSEYHIASLYLALNLIRFYAAPSLTREHAFLSASVLATALGL